MIVPDFVLVDLFAGRVAAIDVSRSAAVVTINSWVELLQRPMPRNIYGPACRHTLFDAGCQLTRVSFGVNGTVSARNDDGNFTTNLSNANGYFSIGMLTWTSGANVPFSRSIRSFVQPTGLIQLLAPMPYLVQAGDAFTAYPGCNKSISDCVNKFNNKANYGGQPFIPSPESAV